jgi:UDP-glucose 4-epimerase
LAGDLSFDNYSIMKVLITGSSGALGKILISSLTEQGTNVVGLDINYPSEKYPAEIFTFYKCCITDYDRLISIFSSEQPDQVIHFACSFNRIRNRRREHEIDVTGSENVLHACEHTLSVTHLIYSSSAAIYGAHSDRNRLLSEKDLVRPGKYRYGMNKMLIEEIFFKTKIRSDLRVTSLRICTVVGPTFSKSGSIVSLLIRFPYMPRFCMKNKMQFIHSDDFSRLFGYILVDKEIKGIYNIAPDDYIEVDELVPWKKYIAIPLFVLRAILFTLWNLRILNLQPAAVNSSIYPMVLDPSRIKERYRYSFGFSSKGAFYDTMSRNQLPSDSKHSKASI